MPASLSYQLVTASIDDCLDLSLCFNDLASITAWGGEGFVFPVQRQQFLLQLHRPDTTSYVFKQHSSMVGFGQICQRFGKHHLARLLVLPGSRGNRFSYALVLSLICRALQQNPKLDFSLFVFRHNAVAVHCYQQLGFEITAQPGPEHKGLYFMQLSCKNAIQLLTAKGWRLQRTSEFVLCEPQEKMNANLD
jgi:ribosomal protein S18 acetylase RimI-like enzyme